MAQKLTMDYIEKVAHTKNPNLHLVRGTYVDLHTSCLWVEEGWGEFERKPYNILYSNSVYHPEHSRIRKNKVLSDSQQRPESKEKRKATNREKYGGDAPYSDPRIAAKTKQTNLARYGCESVLGSTCIQEKIKQTNIEKYGVVNPLLNAEIKKKVAATNTELFGTSNPFGSKKIQEQISQTNLVKYGFTRPSKNKEMQKHTRLIMFAKYGGPAATSCPEVRKKIKKTMQERYGVDRVGDSREFREKAATTNISRYGVACVLQAKQIRAKISATNLLRYGSENAAANACVKRRIHRTRLLRGLYRESKGELELRDFCKTLDTGARSTMAYLNDKSFQIDVLLPSKNICIEYNGMYWHSEENKKHYNLKHLDKTKACALRNRRLIHIWEYEWQNKRPQVESYIRSVTGIFEKRIGARKCKVREITDKTQVNTFLNTNHLLGSCQFSKAIGLFYRDELVGVALLGRHHRTNALNVAKRFAFLSGVQVTGGVSRLTKHLLDLCESDSLLTWADVRLGAEAVYTSAGWVLEATSKPDYFYWQETKRRLVAKQHFKNHRKSLTGVSEKDFARSQGCLRVWDCGKHRFRIHKKGYPYYVP